MSIPSLRGHPLHFNAQIASPVHVSTQLVYVNTQFTLIPFRVSTEFISMPVRVRTRSCQYSVRVDTHFTSIPNWPRCSRCVKVSLVTWPPKVAQGPLTAGRMSVSAVSELGNWTFWHNLKYQLEYIERSFVRLFYATFWLFDIVYSIHWNCESFARISLSVCFNLRFATV